MANPNSGSTPVDTSKVSDYRILKFFAPIDVQREVDRIVAAERAGRLRRSGNWTVGQTLGHLASWINYGYDGYPNNLKPPWFIKLLLRTQRGKFLRGPLPRGVRIPKVEGGTLGTERQELDEGLDHFRAAWARLEKAPPGQPNIIFGPLSHADWMNLHFRHAELHLGYLHP